LIGNMDGLRKTKDRIEELLPIKSERGILLLQFYNEYINNKDLGVFDLEKINILKKKFAQNNDRLLATELQFLMADEYYKKGEFGISISLLHSKSLTDICEFNPKYEAQRLYLLSKIPTKYQSDLTLTKNYLLHKAYAIMKNNSISELTLNVLSDLASFYFDRGNLSKAKEFAVIADTIIKYITLETVSEEISKSLHEIRLKEMITNLDEILNSN
ncbi:MAG: hypothetical protein PF445_02015, partial [Melioribacteraceae bacterium]|nr:hypothetical protein [Melioribacteraceae bacterium]